MARGLFVAFVLSFGPTVSNSFARFAYALILPAMRDDLQWSYSQAGWINTSNAIGYLAGAVLTRLLVVQLGNRALFCGGMFVTAAALVGTGMTADLTLLAAMRVLAGLGGAAVFICGGALSANIFPDRPQLATTTISIYFAGGGIGLMLSGVLVPPALAQLGDGSWPIVWRAMGYAGFAMALGTLWAATRIVEPGAAPGGAAWRLRPFLPELLAYAAFALGYIGYMTFVIAWMRDNGASTATVVLVWSALGLATLLAPAVWRKPFDRWSGGRPMAAVMLVLAAGALVPLVTTGALAMTASAVLFGLAMFSVPSAITSLLKRSLPKAAWGSAMATFTSVFAAGQIAGPMATGWLADLSGSLRPGLTASVIVLVLGALLAFTQPALASGSR
jgi:MFS family permease